MDRHLLLFGSGTNFASGSLPDCLAMTMRTGGLNGTIQPYSIFVADPQRDGPYEQRTKFTTNTQNDALYQTDKIFKDGKMVSTEYTKGHGIATNDNSSSTNNDSETSNQTSDSSKGGEETVHIVHVNPYSEDQKTEDKSVKMSKTDFDKKVAELSEQSNKLGSKRSYTEPESSNKSSASKKSKNHKFQLF